MKLLLIAACFAAAFAPSAAPGQAACTVRVPGNVEVASASLSLADLLEPGSCPELSRAAGSVGLGSAPVAGSVRVFAGAEIRRMVERIRPVSVSVPQRIRVRRAGSLVSCAGLDAPVFAALGLSSSNREIVCGAAGRIPREAPLILGKPVWDPSVGRWQVIARCSHAGDCVPFLVQVSAPHSAGGEASPNLPPRTAAVKVKENILMLPGQIATLLWEQDGIRLTVRATCLDRGRAGDWVRARMAPGGRVLRAVIVSAGILRAGS